MVEVLVAEEGFKKSNLPAHRSGPGCRYDSPHSRVAVSGAALSELLGRRTGNLDDGICSRGHARCS